MMEPAISVRGLGKRYYIGARQRAGYRTLRDALAAAVSSPVRRVRRLLGGHASAAADLDVSIWALRDVDFDVESGEVLGIIGANGAGKSTLLKVLSRITEPTRGRAEIRGRVGSLLEVGTGFHQELTGRENVYLNGAILGMSRAEISAKFDAIVEFAEVERFIDTPVKHYSTGMALRLAFAVAAHLEPEILLVDEVLAVGDAAFQRKCLGKMEEVARTGRTVVFVSHNMGAVTELCERALWLDGGRLKLSGDPMDVVETYLSSGSTTSAGWTRPADPGDDDDLDVRIESIRIATGDGESRSVFAFGDPFQVEIVYQVVRPVRGLAVLCGVVNHNGLIWQSWDTDSTDWAGRVREPGRYQSVCRVPAQLLKPGRYHLNVCTHVPDARMIEPLSHVLAFDISEVGYRFSSKRDGAITPMLDWEVQPMSVDEAGPGNVAGAGARGAVSSERGERVV